MVIRINMGQQRIIIILDKTAKTYGMRINMKIKVMRINQANGKSITIS